MTPALAGELEAVSARWAESIAGADGNGTNGVEATARTTPRA
jgi:hypothetical protein